MYAEPRACAGALGLMLGSACRAGTSSGAAKEPPCAAVHRLALAVETDADLAVATPGCPVDTFSEAHDLFPPAGGGHHPGGVQVTAPRHTTTAPPPPSSR